MDPRLKTATVQEIVDDFGIYTETIKVMTFVDGVAPKGACCGGHKTEIATAFVNNRQKYISKMEEIKNRTIQPNWKGVKYFSKIAKHLNADSLTDATAKKAMEAGVSEEWFIMPAKETVETAPVSEEKPKTVRKSKKK